MKPVVIGRIVNSFDPLSPLGGGHAGRAVPRGGRRGIQSLCGRFFPAGAIWIYDIRDPAVPTPVGYFGLHRERPTVCTAHNFNFVPGTRFLVSSWYQGGMNVLDLTDPTTLKEVAHFQGNGVDYWSAYWYRGRIYASGIPGWMSSRCGPALKRVVRYPRGRRGYGS
ncbi:MAG: hypothetical protein ACRDLB_07190 [Actinomycetota bacterium]